MQTFSTFIWVAVCVLSPLRLPVLWFCIWLPYTHSFLNIWYLTSLQLLWVVFSVDPEKCAVKYSYCPETTSHLPRQGCTEAGGWEGLCLPCRPEGCFSIVLSRIGRTWRVGVTDWPQRQPVIFLFQTTMASHFSENPGALSLLSRSSDTEAGWVSWCPQTTQNSVNISLSRSTVLCSWLRDHFQQWVSHLMWLFGSQRGGMFHFSFPLTFLCLWAPPSLFSFFWPQQHLERRAYIHGCVFPLSVPHHLIPATPPRFCPITCLMALAKVSDDLIASLGTCLGGLWILMGQTRICNWSSAFPSIMKVGNQPQYQCLL